MAEIGILKTFRVFLASSNELKKDREEFERLISRLNQHYTNRGISIILDMWEYLDPAYMDERKQNEYNQYVRNCDVFVVLFYLKAGGFTLEEFTVAEEENKKRKLPLFIYFKENGDGTNEKELVELTKFKNHISLQLEHFWGTYDTTPKLHLDFVLWLDNYLFSGKTEVKAVDGTVTMGGVPVALMSQLPFAANNEEYQRLEDSLKSLNNDIEQIRQDIQKYPNDPEFRERLNKKEMERDTVQEKLETQQEALLGAARRIAEMRKQQVGKKLQEAIDAFEAGQLNQANKILDKLEKEGEQLMEDFETKREQIHEHIDALHLQTQTVMAEAEKPIEERIARIAEIFAKADDWANRSTYNKEKYAKLLYDHAEFFRNYARYDEAETIYLRQIALFEELYGTDSTATATSYNNIGTVYDYQGDYDKALKYYFKALAIYEKVLGTEHHSTATSYNNIGYVFDNLGDYDKALEFYFRALDIHEKYLGKDHPKTATSYNNIGTVYDKQKYYEKALEYYFKALAIREEVLGKDHSDTADSYNNIGLVYYEQYDFDKALEYFFKALDIHEKVLGTKHPNTATDYNNFGLVYYYQGDFDKALEFHLKALAIREKALGTDHPDTAGSFNNIGSVWVGKGDFDKALEYYLKALVIFEKVLGKEHPNTAMSYNNVSVVYIGKGYIDKAREYYRKAEESRKKRGGGK